MLSIVTAPRAVILGVSPDSSLGNTSISSPQEHRTMMDPLGSSVLPHGTTIKTGATVVVTLGTPWLALPAPCRIVGVVDESDRWGFAYRTLRDHPEQGEESFVVSVADEGVVEFKIAAFSRPGEWITRLTGPVGRAAQATGTNGYLKALRRFVNQSQ